MDGVQERYRVLVAIRTSMQRTAGIQVCPPPTRPSPPTHHKFQLCNRQHSAMRARHFLAALPPRTSAPTEPHDAELQSATALCPPTQPAPSAAYARRSLGRQRAAAKLPVHASTPCCWAHYVAQRAPAQTFAQCHSLRKRLARASAKCPRGLAWGRRVRQQRASSCAVERF